MHAFFGKCDVHRVVPLTWFEPAAQSAARRRRGAARRQPGHPTDISVGEDPASHPAINMYRGHGACTHLVVDIGQCSRLPYSQAFLLRQRDCRQILEQLAESPTHRRTAQNSTGTYIVNILTQRACVCSAHSADRHSALCPATRFNLQFCDREHNQLQEADHITDQACTGCTARTCHK